MKKTVKWRSRSSLRTATSCQSNEPVATLNLARAAGIDAASARLEVNDTNRPAALIKRFDRSQGERVSYLSAQSFPGAGAATGGYSTDIADGLRAHASNPREQMSGLN